MASRVNILKNNKTKKQLSKYKIGLTLVVIFSVLLALLLLNIIPLINSFVLGTFGLASYAVMSAFVVFGIMLMLDKQIFLETQEIIFMLIWFVVFVAIIHLVTILNFTQLMFGDFLSATYTLKNTAGGLLFSLIVYPLVAVTHEVGAFVLLGVCIIVLSTVIIDKLYANQQFKKLNNIGKSKSQQFKTADTLESETPILQPEQKSDEEDVIISDSDFNQSNAQSIVLNNQDNLEQENNKGKDKAKIMLGLSEQDKELNKAILQEGKNSENFNYTSAKKEGVNRKDYILTPQFPNVKDKQQLQTEVEDLSENNYVSGNRPRKFIHSDMGVKQTPNEQTEQPKRTLTDSDKKNLEFLRSSLGGDLRKRFKENLHKPAEPEIDEAQLQSQEPVYNEDIYDPNLTAKDFAKQMLHFPISEMIETSPVRTFDAGNKPNNEFYDNSQEFNGPDEINDWQDNNEEINTIPPINNAPAFNNYANNNPGYQDQSEDDIETLNRSINSYVKPDFMEYQKPKDYPKKPTNLKPYVKPPLELLKNYEPVYDADSEDYSKKAQMLEETLSSFKIPAKVVSVTKGPAFTRFELQMPTGIPVKRITGYIDDIAMILQSQGAVRVEIPIPGKNAFGVEVPNEIIDIVGLRDILEAYSFQGSKSLLTFALGKDITGECKVARLDKMPHLLVAGATGSGKSVCLNSLIISLLYKASPDDLRIILIDPKRVEFTLYNGLPHLLVPNVITEPERAISALTWTIDEMERRFTMFSKYRVRNLDEFNQLSEVQTGLIEKMPMIVLIVDELADLMVLNKKELEEKIIRIAQKSRAAGIHLVLATQRPSVNVITGVIKANLPSRIAFAVTSNTDSRTILDGGGAEKLLGKGDMLYQPVDMPEPIRLQGSYISNEEVGEIVEFIKENNDVYFDAEVEDNMFNKKQGGFEVGGNTEEFDPFFKDALRTFIKSNSVSITRLQRVFGIGWPRAAKIVDQMEKVGFISEQDSSKNRQLFISQQEFEEKFGEEL